MRRADDARRLFWPVVGAVVFADLATKLLARALIARSSTHEVIGELFRLTLLYNPGAAFGMHLGTWSRWAFLAIAGVAIAVLARLCRASAPGDRRRVSALALVAGGAAGNAGNRLWSQPGVVDFLDFGVGNWRWPAFNLADIAITIGAMLLAWVFWHEDAAQPHRLRE